MKHCGTQELTTERLVLRRMTTDDCEMMFGNWANDPEVTRYLRWEPHRDWVVTMAYLNEIVKQYDRPDFYDWGICDKVTGVLMGSISIAPAESCEREKPYAWKNVKTELLGGMYEIGYTLGKKWWNQGYATEAAAAVAFLCYEALALAPYGEFSAVGENAGNSGYKGGGSFIFRHALQRRQKLFVIGRIGSAAA